MRRILLVAMVVLGALGLDPSNSAAQPPVPVPVPEVPGRSVTSLPPLPVSGTEPRPVWRDEPVVLSDEELVELSVYGHVLSDEERQALLEEATRAAEPPDLPVVEPGFVPGESTEVPGERSVFGTVFQNPDGSRTSRIASEPVHFERDGVMVLIDSRLAAVEGEPGVFRSAANAWDVTVGDSATPVVMSTPEGEISWVPEGARVVEPVVVANVVTFIDAWPGVDLRYTVESWGVKEEIVLREHTQSSFDFLVTGAGLVPDEANAGGFRPSGALGEVVRVLPPMVTDHEGIPVLPEVARGVIGVDDTPEQVTDVEGQGRPIEPGTQRLSVSVDPGWLAGLGPDEFPVVLDPTVSYGTNTQYAMTQGGTVCANYCGLVQVGNVTYPGDIYYRTVSHFDYETVMLGAPQIINPDTVFVATITMDHYAGSAGNQVVAWWSPNGTYNGYQYPDYRLDLDTSADVAFNVLGFMDSWFSSNTGGGSFLFTGDENAGLYSYRQLDNELLWLTYDYLPAVPANASWSPANGTQIHNSWLSPTWGASTDPENTGVYYRHFVCAVNAPASTSNPTACPTNRIYQSEWVTWQSSCCMFGYPPGIYSVNQTVYWGVETTDGGRVYVCDLDPDCLAPGFRSPTTLHAFTPTNVAPPSPTAGPSAPIDGYVIVNETQLPTLSINTVVDGDGDLLTYVFEIAESGGVGLLAQHHVQPALPAPPTLSWQPPPGLGLVPGRTYSWTVRIYDGWGTPQAPPMTPRTIRFDQRLGTSSPAPMQPAGAASVNLATGNVVAGAATPTLPTTAGNLGFAFSYNSLDRTNQGLTGSYWNDVNQNGVIDTGGPDVLAMRRTDPAIAFDWAFGSPSPSVPPDQFMARWTGWVQVPSTGAWEIAVANDDWVEVSINGVTGLVGCCNANRNQPTPAITTGALTAGTWYPIQVTMREWSGTAHLTLMARPSGSTSAFQQLTADWFRTSAPVVPQGWTLSGAAASGASWVRAAITEKEVVLTAPDGRTATYRRVDGSDPNRGFTPPAGEDDVVSVDSASGNVSVQGTDGTVTAFDSKGTLVSVTNPLDSRSPAAHQLAYSAYNGDATRLTLVTDPVSADPRHCSIRGSGHARVCPVDTTRPRRRGCCAGCNSKTPAARWCTRRCCTT